MHPASRTSSPTPVSVLPWSELAIRKPRSCRRKRKRNKISENSSVNTSRSGTRVKMPAGTNSTRSWQIYLPTRQRHTCVRHIPWISMSCWKRPWLRALPICRHCATCYSLSLKTASATQCIDTRQHQYLAYTHVLGKVPRPKARSMSIADTSFRNMCLCWTGTNSRA